MASLAKSVRDRLRDQARLERDLAARVIAASDRLSVATERRDVLVAEQDALVAKRRDEVAEALIGYLDLAGVGVERAAIILDRPKNEIVALVRRRRSAGHTKNPPGPA